MWKRLSILPFRPEAALALIVAAFVIAAGSLAAVPQTDALIRSTTRLVQMSVVAVDKQGRPVRDLKQTDFDLFDNGKHCPVSVFVIENATLKAAPPLPPHTFTNQLERLTGARSGYAVVLLDWLNTQWSDQV